ncbi:MAG: tetratricopeptide repeat protein [Candidatus Pacebacteria bacterium]|nr:tetratricopeptide repeat protein [Candidatus Paceibacterota bacterium]
MESKKVEFFNKLSFVILLVTIFLSLFFFIPYTPVTLEASKGFLLSVGATLSLFFWLISRLGDGKFVFPKDKLILFAMIIPLVFLIASFFSSSLYISLFGSGFEIGTFGSMLTLFIIFFLSSIYFQSEKRLWYFIRALFIGGLILVLFEVLSLFIDFDHILPGFLQGVSSGNLVGSWNNFALLLGIIVLLAVFTIELLNTKVIFKIAQYLLLLLGILLLVIINISLVWLLVGLFSLIIFVYSLSIQHSGNKIIQGESNKKRFPFISLLVIFISFISLVGSNLVGGFISNYVSLNNLDIRPSITTTSQIAYKAIKHNPFLGTGPNTFVIDWALWQPKDIAQTVFWNVDFTNGYSLLTTFAVTTGLLGLVAMLFFLVIYVTRSIQSIRIALQNTLSNYFIMTTLMISIYSWITVIFYNPNIVMLMLAFCSSGMLIGILVYKQAIPVKDFSFLSDPRNSFFSILGLVVLMVATASLTYIYIEKFTSIIYFSKGLNSTGTMESLSNSEGMFLRAISLDKNDIYYRALSQVYLNQIGVLANDKTISPDILKSSLQQLVNNAQQSASLAVSQNPKQYLNYVNLGDIYGALIPLSVTNSYESAIVAYDKAIILAPNNPSILLAKASLEFVNKNNSEARKFIKQALDLKVNYIDAIFLLVQIETNEGNLAEAIKQAEYAGEMVPNDPTIFFRLGLLRYNNSDYKGAVSAFEKAVILNNSYLNARYFLGQSYKKVGRTSDALIQFNILNKIAPDNQEIKDAIRSINAPELEPEPETSSTKPPLEEKQ